MPAKSTTGIAMSLGAKEFVPFKPSPPAVVTKVEPAPKKVDAITENLRKRGIVSDSDLKAIKDLIS